VIISHTSPSARELNCVIQTSLSSANLAYGDTYAGFADEAHFGWVTSAWRAVVVPNHYLFIGLLVAFEAVVGVLILSGGRRTQLGLVAALGFHLALWLFSWMITIYSLVMVPVLVLLLLAERRATRISTPTSAFTAESPVALSHKS
jgi:hypothetical protein